MFEGVIASLIAGLATGLGAIPIAIGGNISRRLFDGLLGFGAGVMLAAAIFSLIIPAISSGGVWIVAAGIVAGTLVLYAMDKLIPHIHAQFGGGSILTVDLHRGLLVAGAIAIHNFPEGFAVGAAYGSGLGKIGLIIAIAVAIQNIPEGLALAVPFRQAGVRTVKLMLIATASGLAEPIAATFGIIFSGISPTILPFGLAFAGGAMLYVVSDEIIPESHSQGFEHEATFGVIAGFLIMLILQETLS